MSKNRNDQPRGVYSEPPHGPQMGRLQPQAIELEESVLGAIMLESDALSKVIDTLTIDTFYKRAHQLTYEAILSLFERSEPVDMLTVTNKLRNMGKLELVGGARYIAELTSMVASSANIESHSLILMQKHMQRELIKLCGQIESSAYEDHDDVFELLDMAEQGVYQLSSGKVGRQGAAMVDIAQKTIEHLESIRGRKGGITGLGTGYGLLNWMTAGLQPSDLIILAARPSAGKTAFALSLARNAAIIHKAPVAIFSLEMSSQQLVQRMLCSEAQIDASKVRTGKLSPEEWDILVTSTTELTNAPIYIDDTPALSIFDLRTKCRRLRSEHGIQLVIVDYLQLMSSGIRSKNMNREQEISSISRALKQIAKELEIPVVALSQLNRGIETRAGDKRPLLADLRESGAIEQDADVVMFIHRPEMFGLKVDEEGNSTEGVVDIIIGKQRNGPIGDVKLSFDKSVGRFRDFDPANHQIQGGGGATYDSEIFS